MHVYIIGRTGHGKSTYLEQHALKNKGGFLFLDPHGDSIETLGKQFSYWSPTEFPCLGLNPLKDIPKGQRHLVANDIVAAFKAIWGESWGPRLEWILYNSLALGFYGHEITEEHHAMTADGTRYFGLLSLRSPYGDYTDTVGLRNSHDKSFPIGIAFGSRVFVCDDLAFIGDHVIKRKHTVKAKRELPGLVTEIVQPLQDQRINQNQKLRAYQGTPLTDTMADHAILDLYRQDVIGIQAVGHVLKAWEEPPHDWGARTAWRLFNAATFALEGKVAEKPDLTKRLHQVIDGVCERVH